MKTFSILIVFLLFAGSSFAQWQQQNTPNNTDWYYAIDAVSQSVVYAAGGRVLKTTNGGTSWNTLNVPNMVTPIFDIQFYNESTGWMCGHDGKVYITTNGGTNWTIKNAGAERLDAIHFLDANTGFVCGYLGRLYRSTTGGNSWDAVNAGTSLTLNTIFFINNNTGWIGSGGNDTGIIMKTTNGGLTWTGVPILSHRNIKKIQFLTSQLGFACTDYKIYKTTTGGSNWYEVNLPGVSGAFLTFNMSSAIIGYAAKNSHLLKTVDWGENWYEQYGVLNDVAYLDISFAPGSTSKGWMAGTDGAIIYTSNSGGGFIGIQNVSGEVPKNFELSQNYPNPFNPITNINFSTPNSGFIKLVVFDITGKAVAELVNEELTAGSYKVDFNASALSSGIYFYKLVTGQFTQTKKMTLIK